MKPVIGSFGVLIVAAALFISPMQTGFAQDSGDDAGGGDTDAGAGPIGDGGGETQSTVPASTAQYPTPAVTGLLRDFDPEDANTFRIPTGSAWDRFKILPPGDPGVKPPPKEILLGVTSQLSKDVSVGVNMTLPRTSPVDVPLLPTGRVTSDDWVTFEGNGTSAGGAVAGGTTIGGSATTGGSTPGSTTSGSTTGDGTTGAGWGIGSEYWPKTHWSISFNATSVLVASGNGFVSNPQVDDKSTKLDIHLSADGKSLVQQTTNTVSLSIFDPQGNALAPLSISSSGLAWGHPEEGYKDSSTVLTGVVPYTLVGSTPPRDLQGNPGTLNAATLSANFTTSKLNASVDVTVAGQQWMMSGSNISFPSALRGGATFSAQAFASSSGTTSTGFSGESMTVTKVGCPTCTVSGSFNGGFVMQNYAGAMLGYKIAEAGPVAVLDNAITGNAIFQRSTTVTNAAPNPTGRYYILLDGTLVNASAVTTDAGGAMTGFSMGGGAVTSDVVFNGTPANVGTALGAAATYGTWGAAGGLTQIDQTITTALAPTGTVASYTGSLSGISNLVSALTGTANYTMASASAPTTAAGVAGTMNSASLAVDFGKQTFSTSLNATVAANTYATAGTGTLAADGRLSLFNFAPPSTKNGTALTGATLQLAGALTGDDLASAGYAYVFKESFSGTAFNGSVTFTGPTQSLVTTPFRDVLTSSHIDFFGGFLSVSGMTNPAASATVTAANQLTSYITPINPANFGLVNTIVSANSGTTYADVGMDAVTGLIWGRITGQVGTQDRAGAAAAGTANISGSLHYIATAASSTPTTYPLSGVYTYTYVGGTTPTDNAGNTGVLNSATLQADFTNLKAAASVSATVSGTTLTGTTTDARITNTGFVASNGKAVGNLSVGCTGVCGTNNTGSLQGVFTGAGAVGAAMAYGMNTAGTGGLNKTISGVGAFRR